MPEFRLDWRVCSKSARQRTAQVQVELGLPTAALSCRLPPDPADCRPVLPTAAISCRLPPYPANCCHILPTTAISCRLPPYPADYRPRPANYLPIVSTAALSCEMPLSPRLLGCKPCIQGYFAYEKPPTPPGPP